MDNRFQATFIPRQSPVTGASYSGQRGQRSLFMMILVMGAYGALYFYRGFVQDSNDNKKAQVEAAIQNFEPELTNELTVIKARMDAGKTLIENHKAFSLLFSLLELNTVQLLRFTEVSYKVGDDKKIQIAMKGEARSYNAIAYQSDVFAKVEQLKNPVVSNLRLGEGGIISFDFTAELDPSAVSYKRLVEWLPAEPIQAAGVSTTTQATTTRATSTPRTTGTSGVGTTTPTRTGSSTPANNQPAS